MWCKKNIPRMNFFVLHRIHMCCLHCDLELAWYIVLIENIWCTFFYMAWLRVELCMWLEWHKICTCNMCSIGTSRTIACHRIRLSRLLPIFGLFQPKENNNFSIWRPAMLRGATSLPKRYGEQKLYVTHSSTIKIILLLLLPLLMLLLLSYN